MKTPQRDELIAQAKDAIADLIQDDLVIEGHLLAKDIVAMTTDRDPEKTRAVVDHWKTKALGMPQRRSTAI